MRSTKALSTYVKRKWPGKAGDRNIHRQTDQNNMALIIQTDGIKSTQMSVSM